MSNLVRENLTLIDVMNAVYAHSLHTRMANGDFTFFFGLIMKANSLTPRFKNPFDLTVAQAIDAGGGENRQAVNRKQKSLNGVKLEGKPIIVITPGSKSRYVLAKYDIRYKVLCPSMLDIIEEKGQLSRLCDTLADTVADRLCDTVVDRLASILRSDQKRSEKKQQQEDPDINANGNGENVHEDDVVVLLCNMFLEKTGIDGKTAIQKLLSDGYAFKDIEYQIGNPGLASSNNPPGFLSDGVCKGWTYRNGPGNRQEVRGQAEIEKIEEQCEIVEELAAKGQDKFNESFFPHNNGVSLEKFLEDAEARIQALQRL